MQKLGLFHRYQGFSQAGAVAFIFVGCSSTVPTAFESCLQSVLIKNYGLGQVASLSCVTITHFYFIISIRAMIPISYEAKGVEGPAQNLAQRWKLLCKRY